MAQPPMSPESPSPGLPIAVPHSPLLLGGEIMGLTGTTARSKRRDSCPGGWVRFAPQAEDSPDAASYPASQDEDAEDSAREIPASLQPGGRDRQARRRARDAAQDRQHGRRPDRRSVGSSRPGRQAGADALRGGELRPPSAERPGPPCRSLPIGRRTPGAEAPGADLHRSGRGRSTGEQRSPQGAVDRRSDLPAASQRAPELRAADPRHATAAYLDQGGAAPGAALRQL